MNWLNQLTSVWASHDYSTACRRDRGTWHTLLFYCAIVENGGRVVGCGKWTSPKCMSVMKVSLEDIRRVTAYWRWEGDDLVVQGYPMDQQEKAQYMQSLSRYMNDVRWRKRKGLPCDDLIRPTPRGSKGQPKLDTAPSGTAAGNPSRTPCGNPSGTPEGKLIENKNYDEDDEEVVGSTGGFPRTLSEAIQGGSGFEPAFVEREWQNAAARGGRDWKMRDISDWNAYLAVQKRFRDRPRDKAPALPEVQRAPGKLPKWRRIQGMEEELEKLTQKLRRMPQPNPNVFPEEFQQAEKIKAPLRARCDELTRMIAEMKRTETPNQQTPNVE